MRIGHVDGRDALRPVDMQLDMPKSWKTGRQFQAPTCTQDKHVQFSVLQELVVVILRKWEAHGFDMVAKAVLHRSEVVRW